MRVRPDEVTVADAAEILGVHRSTVWRWLTSGALKSRRRGFHRFPLLADVAALKLHAQRIAQLKAAS